MPKCRKCSDTGTITEYHRIEPFNPQSPPQVKNLMRHLHIKIPTKRGENRETTEQKYLRRFSRKWPVFGGILDVRKRGKLISDYLWPRDELGGIRTTYGWHPPTWRKSSRNPNLQVIPKPLNELQEMVRETVCAPPGYVLMEADSEGIEAVFIAYYTGDPLFLKVCKAGPHGYFMAANEGRPIDPNLPFDQLKSACKREKKRDAFLYDVYKRTIHGSHYGLTPFGMHDEYEEQFPTLRDAKQRQDAYFGLWPVFVQWVDRTRHQAHDQRYLDNHFNYRHYFYNVFTWNRTRGQYELGDDGKRCIAFLPQSDASAVQTEYMLTMADRAGLTLDTRPEPGYPELFSWLALLVHDSFIFCLPESELTFASRAAAEVMNQPIVEMGGLRVGVEVKAGPNLREQSTIEVPLIN